MQNALSTSGASGASFKNILLLTDFSPASTPAQAYSLALAQHFKARLFPARVMEDAFTNSTVGREGRTIGVPEERKKHEFISLESFNGIEFNPLISHSDLENIVPYWIAEYGIDLIVVGTCGRRGLQRSLLGSMLELVLQIASCPVLIVGPKVNLSRHFKLAFDKILFPAELGPHSGAGLPYALALASERSANLTLLHVLPEDSCRYRDRSCILRFAMDELQRLLTNEASTFCRPEFAVDAGDVAEQIVRFARNEQPDVIVMGVPSVAESAVQMRASVTYRVISSAACPVLTVRGEIRNDSASRGRGPTPESPGYEPAVLAGREQRVRALLLEFCCSNLGSLRMSDAGHSGL